VSARGPFRESSGGDGERTVEFMCSSSSSGRRRQYNIIMYLYRLYHVPILGIGTICAPAEHTRHMRPSREPPVGRSDRNTCTTKIWCYVALYNSTRCIDPARLMFLNRKVLKLIRAYYLYLSAKCCVLLQVLQIIVYAHLDILL